MYRQPDRWPLLIVILVSLAFSSPGCGSRTAETEPVSPQARQEQLLSQVVATQDQIVQLLGSIRDEQSAREAVSQTDAIVAKIKSLAEQLKSTGEISPETRAKFEKLLAEKKSQMQSKLAEFAGSLLTNPKLLQSLQPLLEKFNQLRDADFFSK